MHVQVAHVRLCVRVRSRQEANVLITALESSVTVGRVDPEEGEDTILEAEVENVGSVREAVAVLAGIASTAGFKPDQVFLDNVGGIQRI